MEVVYTFQQCIFEHTDSLNDQARLIVLLVKIKQDVAGQEYKIVAVLALCLFQVFAQRKSILIQLPQLVHYRQSSLEIKIGLEVKIALDFLNIDSFVHCLDMVSLKTSKYMCEKIKICFFFFFFLRLH